MKKNYTHTLILVFILFSSTTIYAQSSNLENTPIKKMLEKKREFNKFYGFGFRIQLYNGEEKKAKNNKALFEIEFPKVYTTLKYDAPDWKTQVGNYKTRLAADRALINITKKFTGAIVVPISN